jgi:hypothetical protein
LSWWRFLEPTGFLAVGDSILLDGGGTSRMRWMTTQWSFSAHPIGKPALDVFVFGLDSG